MGMEVYQSTMMVMEMVMVMVMMMVVVVMMMVWGTLHCRLGIFQAH